MNCPICKRELIEAKFAICRYWECKEELKLDGSYTVHYRKILYDDNTVQCKYIFPPFFIVSTEINSVITLLKQGSDILSHDSKYVTEKKIYLPIPLLLDGTNSNYVLEKLKLYTTFS